MKRFSSPLSTFSIPVLIGLLVTWGIVHLPFLVRLEHSAFVYPERFSKDTHLAFSSGEPENFVIEVADISSKYTPDTNLASYTIDKDTVDILGNSPLTAANWTFLINSIHEAGVKHLVITQAPSWEDADELTLRALEHELSQLESYVVGINLERGAMPQEFPTYLEGSIIPSPEGAIDKIPEVNQISPHPSIEAPHYGFSQLEDIHPTEEGTMEIPLLVRWDGHLLPSLELASLMAINKVATHQVSYRPRESFILVGRELFIPIDDAGRTSIPLKKIKNPSAAKILESPESTPSLISLVSSESSLQLQQLPFSIQYIESRRKIGSGRLYHRLPFLKEAAFLAIFVLILHRRKWWLTAVVALAYFAFPFSNGEWPLFSPPFAAASAFIILKLRGTGPQEKEKEEPSLSPLKPKITEKVKESAPKKLPKRHSSPQRQPKSSKDRLAKKKRSH